MDGKQGPIEGPIRCANCDSPHVREFCASCGQKMPRRADYAFRALAKEVVSEFANVDGKVSRTLRRLVTRPGELTLDHFNGRRAKYLRPLQLFLLTNVLLFVASPTVPLFSYSLEKYLRYAPPSPTLVEALVRRVTSAGHSHRADKGGRDFAAFAARFDSRVEVQRKSLVVTLAPALALTLYGVFARSFRNRDVRRSYGAHLVFALHYLAFLWIVLAAAGTVSTVVHATSPALPEMALPLRAVLVSALVSVPVVYLYLAMRRAYAANRTRALLATSVSISAFILMLVVYRGLLFFIAFYSL